MAHRAALLVRSLLVLVLCLSGAHLLWADDTWNEVDSPHFRVLTNGSVHDAKQVAQQLEEIRYVFVLRFHNENLESGAPLTVIAARDEQTMRQLLPFLWGNHRDGSLYAGDFFRGWESQYAVIRMDEWSMGQGKDTVFHEYTHSVLHANAHWLPTWMDEGLAEFYSFTRFEGDKIYVGAPSDQFQILRSRPLIPIDQMLKTREGTDLFRNAEQTAMFYAEAWAMVHYMIFGQGMQGGQKLQDFYTMLQQGVPQTEAFAKAFGSTEAMETALRQYLARFLFSSGVLPEPPGLEHLAMATRKLSPAETECALGTLAELTHQEAAAQTLLEKAVALDPNLAVAHQELGFLEFRDGKDADAQAQWATALKLDPKLSRALFAATMSAKPLQDQSAAELGATGSALQQVVALDPDFAQAWVELARLAWKNGQMQQAFEDSAKAERLAPWRAGYRLLTGRILLHGGHAELAATYADFVAKRWGGPDHDEAVDLWNEVPVASRGTATPPVYDVAGGINIVRGNLQSEECSKPGSPAAFIADVAVSGEAQPLHLVSTGPIAIGFSDTFWWGEDHFSPCYHLAGNPVIALYRRSPGSAQDQLLELQVRDPWPGAFSEFVTPSTQPAQPRAAVSAPGSE